MQRCKLMASSTPWKRDHGFRSSCKGSMQAHLVFPSFPRESMWQNCMGCCPRLNACPPPSCTPDYLHSSTRAHFKPTDENRCQAWGHDVQGSETTQSSIVGILSSGLMYVPLPLIGCKTSSHTARCLSLCWDASLVHVADTWNPPSSLNLLSRCENCARDRDALCFMRISITFQLFRKSVILPCHSSMPASFQLVIMAILVHSC